MSIICRFTYRFGLESGPVIDMLATLGVESTTSACTGHPRRLERMARIYFYSRERRENSCPLHSTRPAVVIYERVSSARQGRGGGARPLNDVGSHIHLERGGHALLQPNEVFYRKSEQERNPPRCGSGTWPCIHLEKWLEFDRLLFSTFFHDSGLFLHRQLGGDLTA